MGNVKFMPEQRLVPWLNELSNGYHVFVPVQEQDRLIFKPFDPEQGLNLDKQPTLPPKEIVFPRSEDLFAFKYEKGTGEDLASTIRIKEYTPQGASIVFGARPCGTKSFAVFDAVFDSSATTDPYYKKRRESTYFIALTCKRPGNVCFCHWMGSSPCDGQDSDILFTPVAEGYLAEPMSGKAEELLDSDQFLDGSDKLQEAEYVKQQAVDLMQEPPDLSDIPDKIFNLFEDMDFWDRMAAKCISCGVCTYLCPTCYCFDITDESWGLTGKRVRSWDYCLSYLFTLEASGHNPRPTKSHRLRNRVGHKFCYYPRLHAQTFACCGCGRCIKYCPVCVDIREIILKIKEQGYVQA